MRKIFISNILVLFFLLFTSIGCSSYPSDKYLVENFQNNKAVFEKLVSMIQEDKKVISVSKNSEVLDIGYQKNENILSKARLNEYISLLNQMNALTIRVHTDNKVDNSNFSSIDFLVYESKGLLLGIGGTYKYYIFTHENPDRLVESLDELKSRGGDAFAYKQVSENWYLCLDIW